MLRSKIVKRKLIFISIISCIASYSCKTHKTEEKQYESTSVKEHTNKTVAFPGAQGAGKFTKGGRDGIVLKVTRLEDDEKEGSLRWAVNQDYPRIIVFSVSGKIDLKSRLEISNGDLTIAGQSAPGDGICLSGNSVQVKSDNVIIRFIRFRMGDLYQVEDDALWGRRQSNIIIDHCSMSWSTDECSSFYDNKNFTMQWCILSESLNSSAHIKGDHGYGAIWGGQKATFHHNLIAHHNSRNPRLCGSRYTDRPDLEQVDFRNNVIYNWGYNSGYAAEGGSYNIINNYYKYGPATNNNVRHRIFEPYEKGGIYGEFYVDGNIVIGNDEVSSDNWKGIHPHNNRVEKQQIKSDTEFEICSIPTDDALSAYEKVLLYAGTSNKRDIVDKRIVEEVKTGTVTFSGSKSGKPVIIDYQQDVGGWPQYNTYDLKQDTDNDGIPDYWEDSNGLNKNDAHDSVLKTIDSDNHYTNIEIYLNSIVEHLY